MDKAIKNLLLNIADDLLIIGHRNSEWTGLGPILEEDIAFSSIAQDKIGQAYQIYKVLHEELGMSDPDQIAFMREEKEMKCCKLTEYPIGEYDFSLARHFFFDQASFLRFSELSNSSYSPLMQLARKFKGEIKYHVFHASTWIKSLANGTDEGRKRIQDSLNEVFPLALGMFESYEGEEELINAEVYGGEKRLMATWYEQVKAIVNEHGLTLPTLDSSPVEHGGRLGEHTEHLAKLLSEMSEVFRVDPGAEW